MTARKLRPMPARNPAAQPDQVAELVQVDPAMNGAPLGFAPAEEVLAEPAPSPELAAAAALEDPEPELNGNGAAAVDVTPWTGAQLIDVAEMASGAVVAVTADRLKVSAAHAAELERLSMLTRMERQLLGMVANDAAKVLGTRGAMPPKLAAALFFGGVLLVALSRQRSVAKLAPDAGARAEDSHRSRWGNANDAVPVGAEVRRGGFGPTWGEAPAA